MGSKLTIGREYFNNLIQETYQQTGAISSIENTSERNSFLSSVKSFESNYVYNWQTFLYPLLHGPNTSDHVKYTGMRSGPWAEYDSLDSQHGGLSGWTVTAEPWATKDGLECLWDFTRQQPQSITGALYCLSGRIDEVENFNFEENPYDDSVLQSKILCLQEDLLSLYKDTLGCDAILRCTDEKQLEFSLIRHFYELFNQVFEGGPEIPNVFNCEDEYPEIKLVITTCDILWDSDCPLVELDGSTTTGGAKIELTNNNVAYDYIEVLGGNDITVSWDEIGQKITIDSDVVVTGSTYDLTSKQDILNVDIDLTDGDGTIDTVTLVPGNGVSLTDDGNNNITIDTKTYSNRVDSIANGVEFNLVENGSIDRTQTNIIGDGTVTVSRVNDTEYKISGSRSIVGNIDSDSMLGQGPLAPIRASQYYAIDEDCCYEFKKGVTTTTTTTTTNPGSGELVIRQLSGATYSHTAYSGDHSHLQGFLAGSPHNSNNTPAQNTEWTPYTTGSPTSGNEEYIAFSFWVKKDYSDYVAGTKGRQFVLAGTQRDQANPGPAAQHSFEIFFDYPLNVGTNVGHYNNQINNDPDHSNTAQSPQDATIDIQEHSCLYFGNLGRGTLWKLRDFTKFHNCISNQSGDWVHVAFQWNYVHKSQYDNGTTTIAPELKLWINGSLVTDANEVPVDLGNSGSGGIDITSGLTVFGADHFDTSATTGDARHFDGALRDLAIYTDELTDSEVSDIYGSDNLLNISTLYIANGHADNKLKEFWNLGEGNPDFDAESYSDGDALNTGHLFNSRVDGANYNGTPLQFRPNTYSTFSVGTHDSGGTSTTTTTTTQSDGAKAATGTVAFQMDNGQQINPRAESYSERLGKLETLIPVSGQASACIKLCAGATPAILEGCSFTLKDTTLTQWVVTIDTSVNTNTLEGNTLTVGIGQMSASTEVIADQIISAFNISSSFPFRALDTLYEMGGAQGAGPYLIQIWQKETGSSGNTPIDINHGTRSSSYIKCDNNFSYGKEGWSITIPKNSSENYVFTAENYEASHSGDNTKLSVYPPPSVDFGGELFFDGLYSIVMLADFRNEVGQPFCLFREFIAEKFASKINSLPEFNATSNVDSNNYGISHSTRVDIELVTDGESYNNEITFSEYAPTGVEGLWLVAASGFKGGKDGQVSTSGSFSFDFIEEFTTGQAIGLLMLDHGFMMGGLDGGTIQFYDGSGVSHTYTFDANGTSNTPASNIIGIQSLVSPEQVSQRIVDCINDANSSFGGVAVFEATNSNSDHYIALTQAEDGENNSTITLTNIAGLTVVRNWSFGGHSDIIAIEDVDIDTTAETLEKIEKRFEFSSSGTSGAVGNSGNYIVDISQRASQIAKYNAGIITQAEFLTYFSERLVDSVNTAIPDKFTASNNAATFTIQSVGHGKIYNTAVRQYSSVHAPRTNPELTVRSDVPDEKLTGGDAPCECFPIEKTGMGSKFTIDLTDIPHAGELISLKSVSGRQLSYKAVDDGSGYENGEWVDKWVPSTQTGLSIAAWYKAESANVTVVSSGGIDYVSAWNDSSSNTNSLGQGQANDRPVYIEESSNGQPAIAFDGNTHWLGTGDDNSLDLNTNGVSIFVVKRSKTISTQSVIQKGNSYGIALVDDGNDGGEYSFIGNTSGPYNSSDGTVSKEGWGLISFISNKNATAEAGRFGIFKNGNINVDFNGLTKDIKPDDTNPIRIGGNPINSSDFFDGEISEIIIVDGEVSVEFRQYIEGYLCHKYKLDIFLNPGHPYFNAPPGDTSDLAKIAYKRGDSAPVNEQKEKALYNFRKAVDHENGHNRGVSGRVFSFGNKRLSSTNTLQLDIVADYKGALANTAVLFTPASGQTINLLSGIAQSGGGFDFDGGYKPSGEPVTHVEQYSQDAFFNKWDCTTREIDLTPGNRYEITLTGYNTFQLSSDPLCTSFIPSAVGESGAVGGLALLGSLLGQGQSDKDGLIEFLNHICLSMDQVGIGLNIRNKESCIEDPKNIFLATNFYEQNERVKTVTDITNEKTVGPAAALLNSTSKATHLSKFAWRGPFGRWKLNLSLTVGEASDGDKDKVNLYYKGEGIEIDMFSEMLRGVPKMIETDTTMNSAKRTAMTGRLKTELRTAEVFGKEINRFEVDHYNPFRHRFYRQWSAEDIFAMGVEDLAKRLEGNVIENVPKAKIKAKSSKSATSRMTHGTIYYHNGTVSNSSDPNINAGASGYFWPIFNSKYQPEPVTRSVGISLLGGNTTTTQVAFEYEEIEFDEFPGETFYIRTEATLNNVSCHFKPLIAGTEQDFNNLTDGWAGRSSGGRGDSPRLNVERVRSYPIPGDSEECTLLPYDTMEVVTWGFPSGVFSRLPIDLDRDGVVGPRDGIHYYIAPNDMFVMQTHLEEFTVKLFEGEDICPFIGLSPYSSSDFHWSGGPSDMNCNICTEWKVAGPTIMMPSLFGAGINIGVPGFSVMPFDDPGIVPNPNYYDGTCETFCPPIIPIPGGFGILVDDCEPVDCCYGMKFINKRQEGWAGVEIELFVEGTYVDSYMMSAGVMEEFVEFCVESGKKFELKWCTGGRNKEEVQFIVFEATEQGSTNMKWGGPLYVHSAGDDITDGATFFRWTSCRSPEENDKIVKKEDDASGASNNYNVGHWSEAISIHQGTGSFVTSGKGGKNMYNNYNYLTLEEVNSTTYTLKLHGRARGIHVIWPNLPSNSIIGATLNTNVGMNNIDLYTETSSSGGKNQLLLARNTGITIGTIWGTTALGEIEFNIAPDPTLLSQVQVYISSDIEDANAADYPYDTDSSGTITTTDLTVIKNGILNGNPLGMSSQTLTIT